LLKHQDLTYKIHRLLLKAKNTEILNTSKHNNRLTNQSSVNRVGDRTNAYREVPKSGDKLSILGLGAMRLPEKDGAIDRQKATALVRHAIDSG
jgi:hypothetical protein